MRDGQKLNAHGSLRQFGTVRELLIHGVVV
jgi:hypothetical protein